MKKHVFILALTLFLNFLSNAQTPQAFQYQAVVRDASGTALVSQPVNFQISILSGSVTGTVVYSETHTSSTNAIGVVTLNIGSGTIVLGTFSTIPWGASSHFIKVEADPTGGTSYLDMGTTQLLSVPYSLYSEKAGNVPTYSGGTGINVTGTTITNTSPDQNVTLTQGGATTISGTYPNFTISSTDLNTGTPGGLNKSVQYNNGGVFAGDTAAMVWDNANKRLGVGSSNPTGRVVIKGSPTAPANEPLFEIKNKLGQQIMVVYEDSVHFFITDAASPSNKGGFAVSGRNNSKAMTNDYLKVRPDSTRIYTGDSITGFGVKNIGVSSKTSYMKMTPNNYMIGHLAGKSITTGKYNSFIGFESGYKNNSGSKNYFIGYRSGYNNLAGASNIFIGDSAGFGNTVGFGNVYVGTQSGVTSDSGSFNVFVGYQTGLNNRNGSGNVFQGYQTGYSNTFGGGNTASGFMALTLNTTGNFNVAIGNQALFNNTTGTNNVASGFGALRSNTTGNDNSSIGYFALYTNSTGINNTAIGAHSLLFNTIGNDNTAAGVNALWANTTGIDNTSTGYNSLVFNTTGSDNTANGMTALYANTTGSWNTSMGLASLYNNTTGGNNTAVGSLALFRNTTGVNNTAIGTWSYFTPALAAYNNSTGIGFGSAITASNQIRLGDNTAGMSIGGFAAWTNLSDGRFKKDIKENVPGLEFITRLKPVTYHFDIEKMDDFLNKPDSLRSKSDEDVLFTGFVAQEVEAAAKEIGFDFNGVDKPKNENDFYGLRYAEFTVPLVKAVQEQQKQIEALNTKIKELEAIIKSTQN